MRNIGLLILSVIYSHSAPAKDYNGTAMLNILGKSEYSGEFKAFSSFWQLDKKHESSANGIKVYVNDITSQVDTLLICGVNCAGVVSNFNSYTSPLPFLIKPTDTLQSIAAKSETSYKEAGPNQVLFEKAGVSFIISFDEGKMNWLKFFPNKLSNQTVTPAGEVKAAPVERPAAPEKTETARRQIESEVMKTEPVMQAPAEVTDNSSKYSSFKKAVLDVFNSCRQTGFANIKTSVRKGYNFWNYKYTYTTRVKIPGEKYNMLYSFPFDHSPLDFVSVLYEGSAAGSDLQKVHSLFEGRLLKEFTKEEGWVAACLPNAESKTITDVEVRHERYGAIILDYSKNPKGQHILYLRFLFYAS